MRGGTRLRSSSVEHPPLKRVARVRIPPEVLTRVSSSGRTPVSQAGNTGSNPAARSTSFRDRPIGRTAGSDPADAGSTPAPGALRCNTFHSSSMAEQAAVNRKAGGSSPSCGASSGCSSAWTRARAWGARGRRFESGHPDSVSTAVRSFLGVAQLGGAHGSGP